MKSPWNLRKKVQPNYVPMIFPEYIFIYIYKYIERERERDRDRDRDGWFNPH